MKICSEEVQETLENLDNNEIERRLDLYRTMFDCSATHGSLVSESSTKFPTIWIPLEEFKIELIAGGLSPEQQDFLLSKFQTNKFGEVFLSVFFNLIQSTSSVYLFCKFPCFVYFK